MNIFPTALRRALLPALALSFLILGLAACDVDSVDSTTANLADNEGNFYNYAGMYMSASNTSGSTNGYSGLVFPAGRQSGVTLTWMRLLQYGSVIEAYDNAGLTWYGEVTAQNGEVASFQLSGRTTAGLTVQIAGTLTYVSQLSTMDATWIEPNFSGSIFAQATVSPVVTSKPPAQLSISPSSATLTTNDTTETFTASGGTQPYSWTATGGTLSSSTGNSVTFTTSYTSGSITVTDANTNSATATITYGTTGSSALSIDPSTLNLNTSVFKGTFKATGGNGTYLWMLSDASLGELSSASGSSVTYTSKKVVGTNIVTAVDTDNKTASAYAIYK